MNLLLGLLFTVTLNFNQFFETTDRFFKQFVENKRVDYQEIKENPEMLDSLIETVSILNWKNQPRATQKAFLINVYNLLVIDQIVANYPVGSPKDIGGLFDEVLHEVYGVNYTLDQIEFDLLMEKFEDPKVLFALSSGNVDGPVLLNKAYTPCCVDDQLRYNVKLFFLSPERFQVIKSTNTLKVSKLFDWHKQYLGDKNKILSFIDKYSGIKISSKYSLSYLPYDWTLNDI